MKPSMLCMSCFFTVLISFSAGCLGWEPGWKQAQGPAAAGNVNMLLVKAKLLANQADLKEKVQKAIAAYEEALKIDPQNITALNELGMFYFLKAYCYDDTDAEKKLSYLKSLQYNERAMYANPEFKALADMGEPVWEACRVLGKKDMRAMYRWYLALGNCWTDCYGICGKLLNCRWPGRSKKEIGRASCRERG